MSAEASTSNANTNTNAVVPAGNGTSTSNNKDVMSILRSPSMIILSISGLSVVGLSAYLYQVAKTSETNKINIKNIFERVDGIDKEFTQAKRSLDAVSDALQNVNEQQHSAMDRLKNIERSARIINEDLEQFSRDNVHTHLSTRKAISALQRDVSRRQLINSDDKEDIKHDQLNDDFLPDFRSPRPLTPPPQRVNRSTRQQQQPQQRGRQAQTPRNTHDNDEKPRQRDDRQRDDRQRDDRQRDDRQRDDRQRDDRQRDDRQRDDRQRDDRQRDDRQRDDRQRDDRQRENRDEQRIQRRDDRYDDRQKNVRFNDGHESDDEDIYPRY